MPARYVRDRKACLECGPGVVLYAGARLHHHGIPEGGGQVGLVHEHLRAGLRSRIHIRLDSESGFALK